MVVVGGANLYTHTWSHDKLLLLVSLQTLAYFSKIACGHVGGQRSVARGREVDEQQGEGPGDKAAIILEALHKFVHEQSTNHFQMLSLMHGRYLPGPSWSVRSSHLVSASCAIHPRGMTGSCQPQQSELQLVTQQEILQPHTQAIASFPGPAQLFVACSMEKRGEPGIFSHVSMM